MEEKKFVKLKKEEYSIKEYVKKNLGRGKSSAIIIEYTPVGEKIIIETSRPGFIIGKKGERINELTSNLKKKFKLENPVIEIKEIENPDFDASGIAEEISIFLERFGSMRFKEISYKTLTRIKRAGALGAEIQVSGKLPSARAKSWRFTFGYLKKTGDTVKAVNKAQTVANTPSGTVGVKISILPPKADIHDRIEINQEVLDRIKLENIKEEEVKEAKAKEKKSKTKPKKKKK
jgi:small subunit ribosomal protein S3